LRSLHDGDNWTFAAQAQTINGVSYAQPVAYIARAAKTSICFDSAEESSDSLAVDAYSTALVVSESQTSNSVAFTLQANALTVTNFANTPNAAQPCEVQIEFDPALALKTYTLGHSETFSHTAASYVAGTCAGGTFTYTARQTNLSALPAWVSYSSRTFTVSSA